MDVDVDVGGNDGNAGVGINDGALEPDQSLSSADKDSRGPSGEEDLQQQVK